VRAVVVELHGGPEDRWLPRYAGFAQALAARGIAVVRPDVRGSSGYGRAFAALDDGPHRTDVLRDVAATLAWVARRRELAHARIFVMGHSYGGFLALSALHAFPDRLRGAIALAPIIDLPEFLAGTAAYRRAHRRAEYGDERDPHVRDALARISPGAFATELHAPLLIAYGLRDARVPADATTRFIRAARAGLLAGSAPGRLPGGGTPVWSLAAADEGHWFAHADTLTAYEALVVELIEAGM
jgi:dipeptidyl aminopeptidase/acylaminoacyl peptidase